jgi:hypothetical protein
VDAGRVAALVSQRTLRPGPVSSRLSAQIRPPKSEKPQVSEPDTLRTGKLVTSQVISRLRYFKLSNLAQLGSHGGTWPRRKSPRPSLNN